MLKPCEAVVGKSRGSGKQRLEEANLSVQEGGVGRTSERKAEKKKQTLEGLQRQRIEARIGIEEKRNFKH